MYTTVEWNMLVLVLSYIDRVKWMEVFHKNLQDSTRQKLGVFRFNCGMHTKQLVILAGSAIDYQEDTASEQVLIGYDCRCLF